MDSILGVLEKKMKQENTKIKILRTITLVSCIAIIGFILTACQTSVKLDKVKLQDVKEEFEYPTKNPSVVEGKKIFESNCASCHNSAFTKEYVNKVSPSQLFKIVTSDKSHPSFKDKLSIKERWDAVMYLRYQVFGLPEKMDDLKTRFGASCAVCHGTRGHADGSLHYYLNPPPANFTQFSRLYEKTDEKIFEEISNGIPWTAMPPWKNRVDKDKHFEFDDAFRWELVKYVRHFGYSTEADLLRDKELFEHKKENK